MAAVESDVGCVVIRYGVDVGGVVGGVVVVGGGGRRPVGLAGRRTDSLGWTD